MQAAHVNIVKDTEAAHQSWLLWDQCRIAAMAILQYRQQSGFARPAFTNKGNTFPFGNFNGNAVQYGASIVTQVLVG